MTPSSVLVPDRNGRRERLEVRSSPLTYSPHTEHRYFVDLLSAHRGQDDAVQRLRRHEKEMRGEMPNIERRGSITQPEGVQFEYRTPSGAQGQGGYFTPPLWAVEMEGTYPRPERVLSDLADPFLLPQGVSSVNVPVLTRGTSTGQQAAGTPVSDTDVTDTASTSPVVTITGQADIPVQMLEQSPRGTWERVLQADLEADYDSKLEAQLVAGVGGTGIFGQITGLLNVSGVNSITYADSSPSGSEIYAYFGQSFGAVSDNRKIRPEGWLMRGGRFAWLASSEDASSRPLEVPLSAASLITDPSKPTPIGALLGLPVFTDEAIPTNLGTTQTQDAIVAFRWSDHLVWESDPIMNVFTQAISGTLQARVQYHRYVAAIVGRYPSGTAVLGGTGLVVQTNE